MRMVKELNWSLKKPFPTKGQKNLLCDHCTNTLNKQNFELYLRVMTRFKRYNKHYLLLSREFKCLFIFRYFKDLLCHS